MKGNIVVTNGANQESCLIEDFVDYKTSIATIGTCRNVFASNNNMDPRPGYAPAKRKNKLLQIDKYQPVSEDYVLQDGDQILFDIEAGDKGHVGYFMYQVNNLWRKIFS